MLYLYVKTIQRGKKKQSNWVSSHEGFTIQPFYEGVKVINSKNIDLHLQTRREEKRGEEERGEEGKRGKERNVFWQTTYKNVNNFSHHMKLVIFIFFLFPCFITWIFRNKHLLILGISGSCSPNCYPISFSVSPEQTSLLLYKNSHFLSGSY